MEKKKIVQILLLIQSLLTPLVLAQSIQIRDELESNQCSLPQTKAHSQTPLTSKQICVYIEQNCDTLYFKIAQVYYCNYHTVSSLVFISSVIIFALCLILLALSILVSNYLFRNLNELTTKFGLNNQILSFILIPLTNSFPDLINYFVVLKSGSSNLVIGQLMGSLLIMFTLIIGLIAILTKSFTVEHPKLLIIDLAWILVVLILFSYILSDGKITQLECIIMSAVYVAYIVFLSVFDKDKLKNYDEELVICHEDHDHVLEQPYNIEDALSIISNEEHTGYGSITSRSRTPSPVNSPLNSRCSSPLPSPSPTSTSMSISKSTPLPLIDGMETQNAETLKTGDSSKDDDYLLVKYVPKRVVSASVSPTSLPPLALLPAPQVYQQQTPHPGSRQCLYQYQQHNAHFSNPRLILTHSFQAICNCIDFVLIFLVPFHRCIEQEDCQWKSKIRHNKFTAIWYYIEIPLLFNYQFFETKWQYLVPAILFSLPLAIVASTYLNHDAKLVITSITGIIASLVVISNISIYILQILKNLGLMWKISDYLLGMMVFAISNSINDVITNITLSTKINPILGINSCLGTPLLIILLGVGFNGLMVIHNASSQGHGSGNGNGNGVDFLSGIGRHSIHFDLKPSVILDTTALIFTITFILIYLPWNKWRMDVKLGVILISWYFVVTLINLYLE